MSARSSEPSNMIFEKLLNIFHVREILSSGRPDLPENHFLAADLQKTMFVRFVDKVHAHNYFVDFESLSNINSDTGNDVQIMGFSCDIETGLGHSLRISDGSDHDTNETTTQALDIESCLARKCCGDNDVDCNINDGVEGSAKCYGERKIVVIPETTIFLLAHNHLMNFLQNLYTKKINDSVSKKGLLLTQHLSGHEDQDLPRNFLQFRLEAVKMRHELLSKMFNGRTLILLKTSSTVLFFCPAISPRNNINKDITPRRRRRRGRRGRGKKNRRKKLLLDAQRENELLAEEDTVNELPIVAVVKDQNKHPVPDYEHGKLTGSNPTPEDQRPEANGYSSCECGQCDDWHTGQKNHRECPRQWMPSADLTEMSNADDHLVGTRASNSSASPTKHITTVVFGSSFLSSGEVDQMIAEPGGSSRCNETWTPPMEFHYNTARAQPEEHRPERAQYFEYRHSTSQSIECRRNLAWPVRYHRGIEQPMDFRLNLVQVQGMECHRNMMQYIEHGCDVAQPWGYSHNTATPMGSSRNIGQSMDYHRNMVQPEGYPHNVEQPMRYRPNTAPSIECRRNILFGSSFLSYDGIEHLIAESGTHANAEAEHQSQF